ncbi:MAG: ABC transporter permease [Leptospirillia bacterium]
MPFTLHIALRYLRARKRHRALSVNTVISVVGVMFGVAALIATLAVMNGAMEEIRDKILGTNSHVVVSHVSGAFGDYPARVAEVATTPEVVAATPFIYGQAMLTSEFGVQGVILRGIDPEREGTVTDLAENLKIGSLDGLTAGAAPGFAPEVFDIVPQGPVQPGIVLGKELALKLGALVGGTINVISPAGEVGPMGIIPKIRPFTVVGIFDSGMFEYDSGLAYVSLSAAQDFLELGEQVTGIEVRVRDIEHADRVAMALREVLPDSFGVRDWRDLNRNFFSALALEKAVMSVILTLIIVVAAFNIIGTLAMLVVEKGREVAILRAQGVSRREVRDIFAAVGLMIGGVGTALGVPLGLIICLGIQKYEFPGDVYYISHIPTHLSLMDGLSVCAAALLISLLAALFPARQAARVSPADGLRYE